MTIELSELLTEDEIKILPFSSANFKATEELVSLIKRANNEDIFIGKSSPFFSGFDCFTRSEIDKYAEWWATDLEEPLEDVKNQIYNETVKVERNIIRKILKAIK